MSWSTLPRIAALQWKTLPPRRGNSTPAQGEALGSKYQAASSAESAHQSRGGWPELARPVRAWIFVRTKSQGVAPGFREARRWRFRMAICPTPATRFLVSHTAPARLAQEGDSPRLLPLLHTLVEERAGERRFSTSAPRLHEPAVLRPRSRNFPLDSPALKL